MTTLKVMITKPSEDYELIDSGNGEKLERFGSVVLSRPDPQVLWEKSLDENKWSKADALFIRHGLEGKWNIKEGLDKKWSINFSGLKFWIKPTAFKHTGLFPEQSTNWDWLRETISQAMEATSRNDFEVLNLFGYTGGATLACAQAGARVVHIDSSKAAVTWARENAELSGLADKPIRWIIEDARVFVDREIKRGRKYDGIIMDPPSFGHGVDDSIWKIEDDLLKLIENCMLLLKDQPLFFLVNGYSAGYSALAYKNILQKLVEKYKGAIEIGELAIQESEDGREVKGDRGSLLPAGIFARWVMVGDLSRQDRLGSK